MPFIPQSGPVGVWLSDPIYESLRTHGPLKYSEMQASEVRALFNANNPGISPQVQSMESGIGAIVELAGTIRPFPSPTGDAKSLPMGGNTRLFSVPSAIPLQNNKPHPLSLSTLSLSSGFSSMSSSSGYGSTSSSLPSSPDEPSSPSVLKNVTAWIRFPTELTPLRPQDLYSVTPSTCHVNPVGTLVEFFVNTPPRDENNLPEGRDFSVTVIDPVGCITPTFIQGDCKATNRYSCSFVASQTGKYLGYVQIWNKGLWNVKHSPIVLRVSRSYVDLTPSLDFIAIKDKQPRFLIENCLPDFNLSGIAADPVSEKIYIADRKYNKVRVFDMDGVAEADIGTWKTCGCLSAIAVDHTNRRLVLCDKENHQVILSTLHGKFITSFGKKGSGDGEFYKPMGVAVSPKGNIIAVVDGMNHSLQLFDKHGNFLRKCSTFIMDHDEVSKGQENESEDENEEADYPRSICFDKSGEFLYVSDYNSNSLLRFNVELTSMERLPWYFCILMGPRGLTVDSSGNILLCDSKNNCIRVVEPSGNMQAIIGGHDQLKSPCDVTVLQNNQIAVLDGRGIVTIY